MFGRISTENLFLVRLQQIVDIKDIDLFRTKLFFSDNKRYVFARRENYHTNSYKDVLTNIIYFNADSPFDKAKDSWMIIAVQPVITDYKYIPEKVLAVALRQLNPSIFKNKENVSDEEKETKEKHQQKNLLKQKLFKDIE